MSRPVGYGGTDEWIDHRKAIRGNTNRWYWRDAPQERRPRRPLAR